MEVSLQKDVVFRSITQLMKGVIYIVTLAVEIRLVDSRRILGVFAQICRQFVRYGDACAVERDFALMREQYGILLGTRCDIRAQQLAYVHRDGDNADGLLGVVVLNLFPQHQL